MTRAKLRELADRLESRPCAPSLEGYGLVDGLRAAADLLEGSDGPIVHADDAAEARDMVNAPCISLLAYSETLAPSQTGEKR